MDVRSLPLVLIPLKVSFGRTQGFAPTFYPGEQLIAKVLAQVTPGRLMLEIGGRRLVAESHLALKPGDRLRLEVVHTDPKPHLKVIGLSNPALTTALALRHALPRQTPLDQALQSLKASLDHRTLAPPVRTQIEALLNSLPDRIALGQPDKLQAAMRLSGLFTEALAATAVQTSGAETDLKTRLLELAAGIKTAQAQTPAAAAPQVFPAPTPHNSLIAASSEQETPISQAESTITGKPDPLPELAEKISGALARIVLDQIASLPKPDTQILTWQLEIPFRDGERLESLRLTIAGERQSKGDLGEPSSWTVDLEMAPPGLGRIRVKLVLQGEKISSYWWGEKETTSCLLEHHLDTLASRFRAVGLEPNRLQAVGELRTGTKPAPTEPMTSGLLLDEKI